MPKLLTQLQVDHARREGYICPVRIISRDRANHCVEKLDAYVRQTGERARDLKVKGHLLFKWMIELGTTPTLLDAIEDLIGPDIMLTTSAVWPKKAYDPAFVTWHQDSAYFGYEPVDVWSAWIGITDSTVENGCLRYLPGAHLKPEMPHQETFHEDNLLSRGQYIPDFDESSAVDAQVEAGEATIHHFRLPHSSKPNLSDKRRIGILFVFCPPYVRYTLGRYPAVCVRGEDTFGHWDADPLPKRDLDPDTVEYFHSFAQRYSDPGVRSEAERTGLRRA